MATVGALKSDSMYGVPICSRPKYVLQLEWTLLGSCKYCSYMASAYTDDVPVKKVSVSGTAGRADDDSRTRLAGAKGRSALPA